MMKPALFGAGLLALATGVLWFTRGAVPGAAEPGASLARQVQAPGVVGVEELMRNVERHQGNVTVEGVVQAVSEGTLCLIDKSEFSRCGVTTCADLVLPVKWSGKNLSVQEVVRVTGRVREQAGKLVFVASALEAVPSPAENR